MQDVDHSRQRGVVRGTHWARGDDFTDRRTEVARRDGTATTAPHPADEDLTWLSVGSRFGEGERFELVEPIGAGGIGRVFKVRDLRLERDIAAKFIVEGAPLDGSPAAHLLLEARATARLNHRNIVSIFDVGEFRKTPYFLMEYVQGTPLDRLLALAPLSHRRALSIIRQVVRGARHAHRAGVLHLDLKPGNVIVSGEGRVKIVDFGVAGYIAACASGADVFAGTPAYMAPEQWLMGPLDERTDVWAVGLMLREMLTGAMPEPWRHRPSSASTTCVQQEPSSPSGQVGVNVPRILSRALAYLPEERFADMDELLNALAGALPPHRD